MLGAPSGGGFGGPGHLESIGRRWELHPEEHRNLPPTGLPSSASGASAPGSFGSQASAQPLLQVPSSVPNASWTGGPPASGGNVRISVPRLMDDGRLGLIIQNCWVSSISNPTAAQFGWQVGDHILQVNGHPVSNMQQLSEEIRRAVNSHQAVAHPLVFDVWRASPQALSAAAAASGVQRRQKMACCDWDACDCLGSDPVLASK
ncbi:unnamed protein product [Effrenium voratum]|nr:unnamed protein product [Effrenium voratum]